MDESHGMCLADEPGIGVCPLVQVIEYLSRHNPVHPLEAFVFVK